MEKEFFADSACLIGRINVGPGAYFAQGTVVRSGADSITVANGSSVQPKPAKSILSL